MTALSARLTLLRARIVANTPGATNELAVTVAQIDPTLASPAELRFLLRVLVDTGAAPHHVVAPTLASLLGLLAPMWRPGRWNPVALEDICSAVESEAWLDAARLLGRERLGDCWDSVRLVVSDAGRAYDLPRVLPTSAHEVARALAAAQSSRSQRDGARLRVYCLALEPLIAELRPGTSTAAPAFVHWLVEEATLIQLVPNASWETFVARMERALEVPVHERAVSLEAALLADPDVEEVFATRADLARALVAWG